MPISIFPQDTFEKQTNGTLFYKEGKLTDFPAAGPGVFSSWRYNFDAGKQIFRAETTGKIFEKRIVKDNFGNPRWTGWMEIPDAEAHGIQAVAINDRPLQLPNSDGAIKLNITPQVLNTYTKEEIIGLVDRKIEDNNNAVYTYVEWQRKPDGTWADSAIHCLDIKYPQGGEEDRFYLVEPHPGTSGAQEEAEFFMWGDISAPLRPDNPFAGAKKDWIPLAVPDMRAFISYPVYYEHIRDFHVHVTSGLQNNWNAASGLLETTRDELLQAVDYTTQISGQLHEHIADDLPHITEQERDNWNTAYQGVLEFPKDAERYIISQGGYQPSFEQIKVGDEKIKSAPLFPANAISLKDGGILVTDLLDTVNDLANGNNIILSLSIDIGKVNTSQASAWFETDQAVPEKSAVFATGNWTPWKISWKADNPINTIYLRSSDPSKTISLSMINIKFAYQPREGIVIGDRTKVLPLDFQGPEDILPTYNGVPLNELDKESAKTAEWGKISGVIQNQADLQETLAELLSTKINHAPFDPTVTDPNNPQYTNNHKRFDVYRDTVLPSYIQNSDGFDHKEITIPITNRRYSDGDVVLDGVLQHFNQLEQQGFVPVTTKLYIEMVSLDNKNPIPVYFTAEGGKGSNVIPRSPLTGSSEFNWDWPGDNTWATFDKIVIRTEIPGGKIEYLTNATLKISCVKYGDVVLDTDDTGQGKGSRRNFTVNVSGLFENVESSRITYIDENKEEYVEGFERSEVKGNSSKYIEGNYAERISGNASKILNGNSTHTIAGNLTQNIAGNSANTIEKDSDRTIDGNETVIIGGSSKVDIKADSDRTIDGNETVILQGNYSTAISGDLISEISGKAEISIEETLQVSVPAVDIVAEEILLGDTPKDYDEAGDVIEVYGQEIDSRYAARTRYEETSGVLSGYMFDETEERISGDAFEAEERISGDLHLKQRVDSVSGNLYAVSGEITFETAERISGDIWFDSLRIEGDEYLSGALYEAISGEEYNRISGDTELKEYADEISGYVNTLPTKEFISGLYYNKEEIDDTRYTKTEVDEMISGLGERYDLIISSNAELADAIDTGKFAASPRILFATGDYDYTGTHLIDLTNIKYIKGEEPVNVTAPNAVFRSTSADKTILDTIQIKINTGNDEVFLDSFGSPVKEIMLGGNTDVELDKYHSIYRFTLNEDSEVTFENVEAGRLYTFFVDQINTSEPHKFAIKNHLHNAFDLQNLEDFFSETQAKPRTRTVIIALGTDVPMKNGFIITEVIPNVESDIAAGGNFKIEIGNVLGTLNGSTTPTVKAVKLLQGDGRYNFGEKVIIESSFLRKDGSLGEVSWTHNTTHATDTNGNAITGYDWIVYDKADPTKVYARGKVGEEGEFIAPNTITTAVIDFFVDPMLVEIKYDPAFDTDQKTSETTMVSSEEFNGPGFKNPNALNGKFQPEFDVVTIVINALDTDPLGYHIYKIVNNIGQEIRNPSAGTWKFIIESVPANNVLFILPFTYRRIYDISAVENVLTPIPLDPVMYTNKLVYYDDPANSGNPDPGKLNNIKYLTTPPNPAPADDPIVVINYNQDASVPQIEIVAFDKIRVLSYYQPGDIIEFTAHTASGYEKRLRFEIILPVPAGLKIDDTFQIMHKNTEDPQEYDFSIVWPNGVIPSHVEGTWSIVGNTDIAELVGPNANDHIKVKAKKIGNVTLKWVSSYDTTKQATLPLTVYVHPHSVSIKPVDRMKTTQERQLSVQWYADAAKTTEIAASEITHSGVEWFVDNDDLDIAEIDKDTGLLTIRGDSGDNFYPSIPLPGDTNYPRTIKVRVMSQDNEFDRTDEPPKDPPWINNSHVAAELIIPIVRNSYVLEFVSADPHYKGVAGTNAHGLHTAEKPIAPEVAFENGWMLDEIASDIAALNLWHYNEIDSSDGIWKFTFDMPYRDVRIHIVSKQI